VSAAAAAGRIGPNAITQCLAALRADLGPAASAALMAHAGLHAHVSRPPQQMVDEADVQALHHMMRAELGIARARALSRVAGFTTGDYLLAHRIPMAAQRLLGLLPCKLAGQALLAAVTRHAWTFCGSGQFQVLLSPGPKRLRVSITHCITCRDERADQPLCDYYAACFERLFQVIVHPRTRVVETQCEAMGAAACVFEMAWA
jgi:divinyl protochlorophyllide a 8-vinyl-reductase